MLGQAPSGDHVRATILDVGRVPVAGLVEPALELGRVLAERALVLSRLGRTEDVAAVAAEASALADALAYGGYRDTLARAVTGAPSEV